MASKISIKKRVLIGVGLSVVAFFLSKVIVAKYYKKKATDKQSNFLGADGTDDTFVAKRYDPNHINSDRSKGATWIAFNNSDIVGYWEKGKIEIGTEIQGLI
jgi:hypothetical protein